MYARNSQWVGQGQGGGGGGGGGQFGYPVASVVQQDHRGIIDSIPAPSHAPRYNHQLVHQHHHQQQQQQQQPYWQNAYVHNNNNNNNAPPPPPMSFNPTHHAHATFDDRGARPASSSSRDFFGDGDLGRRRGDFTRADGRGRLLARHVFAQLKALTEGNILYVAFYWL